MFGTPGTVWFAQFPLTTCSARVSPTYGTLRTILGFQLVWFVWRDFFSTKKTASLGFCFSCVAAAFAAEACILGKCTWTCMCDGQRPSVFCQCTRLSVHKLSEPNVIADWHLHSDCRHIHSQKGCQSGRGTCPLSAYSQHLAYVKPMRRALCIYSLHSRPHALACMEGNRQGQVPSSVLSSSFATGQAPVAGSASKYRTCEKTGPTCVISSFCVPRAV